MFRSLAATSALVVCAAPLFFATPAAAANGVSREEVQTIIKEYLDAHPEVVVDALKKYQEKQEAESAAKAKATLKDKSAAIFNDPSSPMAGNPKGDVTVVEFFDYHCGYCKRMLPVISALIKEDKNVKVVFKEFPILSQDSELASRAALAVYKVAPDKYFAYHSVLMSANGRFDEANLLAEAKKLGVDTAAMKKEMDAGKTDAGHEIMKNREIAGALGIQGTPAFIIGDQVVPGAISMEELKKAIAAARKK